MTEPVAGVQILETVNDEGTAQDDNQSVVGELDHVSEWQMKMIDYQKREVPKQLRVKVKNSHLFRLSGVTGSLSSNR